MTRKATRLVVISDLHISGSPPLMLSKPERLGDFLTHLPARLGLGEDERLELVINGDFIDFLAMPNADAWTPDPDSACKKLRDIMAGPCVSVFKGLRKHVRAGHLLTILVGNHDVELFLPACERLLLRALGGSKRQVRLLSDGAAYRVGGVLIEHGNRYDDANLVDLDALRETRSAQSRGEAPIRQMVVSEGTQLVVNVLNRLKTQGYPFLDLLQPCGELVALLLVALEPSLALNVPRAYASWRAARLQERNVRGRQPRAPRHVYGRPPSALQDSVSDHELGALFQDSYRALTQHGSAPIAGSSVFDMLAPALRGGILAHIKSSPQDALLPLRQACQLQAVLRRCLDGDRSLALDGPTGPCGAAAERLSRLPGVEIVIMGHTHQARRTPKYLNTGTWADLIQIPEAALVDSNDGRVALCHFLHRLIADQGTRTLSGYYADLRIGRTGRVEHAELRSGVT